MPDNSLFEDSGNTKETEYFRKKEEKLIEKVQARAAVGAQLQQLSTASKITDEAILKDLQEMGYTRETVTLLHLVPMVEVAWASGQVTKRERSLIMEAAHLRGVIDGSPAHRQLQDWLNSRPPADFFQKALPALRAMLMALPGYEQQTRTRSLVGYCTRVAAASGGILGFGQTICDAEYELLKQIASELERDHGTIAEEVVRAKEESTHRDSH